MRPAMSAPRALPSPWSPRWPWRELTSRRQVGKVILAFREAPEIDMGLALVAFIALLVDPVLSGDSTHLSAAAGVLAALTSAPLVVRRRYPLGVLAMVTAGVLASLAAFHPDHAAVGVVMLAVYTVGLQGRRGRSLLVGAAMAPLVAAAVAITGQRGFEPAPMVAYLALVLVALVAGDARRGRLALVRAIAEETEREGEAATQHHFDEQRLRLAHELHDTVAHALVAINVRAAAAAHLQRGEPGESSTALEEIKRTSADALAELRSTLKMLRPAAGEAPLRPAQSLTDLTDLIEGLGSSGIAIDLRMGSVPPDLPAPIGHAGYRIVQEALTNVLRHSNAQHATVWVGLVDGALEMEVLDDGASLTRHPTVAGHGLQGMSERALALGGRSEAGAAAGGGWRVWACLPVATVET
jgi:signal transduction histidine kinase